jgi:alcohol dehydrogenase class IV
LKSLQHIRKFVSSEVVYGVNSIELVKFYVKNFEGRKALIVTDDGVIKAGWTKMITDSLEEGGVEYVVFSGITPNPRSEEVMLGARIYDENDCDVIVAVGGGSPMDCAKGIGIAYSNRQNILQFEGVDNVENPMPPLICVPTTAGTASEVSQFAIISVLGLKTKIAIISKTVIPDVAIIDPQVLISKNAYLTACTGMDALVHAIEAYVSNGSSPLTDLHALEAVRLINSNLVESVNDLQNIELRKNMMLGSLEAGFAFSNASLGAVHAMSHSLGGRLDLPHGECNAVLLEHVIDYNYNSAPEKYKNIAEAMGIKPLGLTSDDYKKRLIERVKELKYNSGITKSLAQMGVTKELIPDLSLNAIKDACIITNPRKPAFEDIEVIYDYAL